MAGPGVLFAPRSHHALQQGINRLADVVRPTLGPTPRHVAIANDASSQPPELLDDAATILRRVVQTPDPYTDMGAMLLRHTLARTAQTVGDGTATTAILLQAIVQHGIRLMEAGYDAVAIRRGLERGSVAAIAALRAMARPLEGREAIARCAQALCHDDELASLLGEIFDIVGTDGHVQVDTSYNQSLGRQYIEGAYWKEGFLSPYFVTNQAKQESRLNDAAVLVTDLRITTAEQLAPLLDRVLRAGVTRLMIIAPEVSGPALGMLVLNHQQGVLQSLAVRAPLPGSKQAVVLDDLAILTGGTRISAMAGWRLEQVTLAELGQAREVWATATNFGISGGQGDPSDLRQRIAEIRSQISPTQDATDRELLRERLGKLWGGAAVLQVGSGTRTHAETRTEYAQRMVTSLRFALEAGVVPGGGHAFLACQDALRPLLDPAAEEYAGLRALYEALTAPLAAIAQNAGCEATTVVAQARRCSETGFDARHQQFVDLWEAGIVDPLIVAETALTTAVSGAMMALTTDVLVHRRNPTAVIKP